MDDTRLLVDATAGGSLMSKSYLEGRELLNRLTYKEKSIPRRAKIQEVRKVKNRASRSSKRIIYNHLASDELNSEGERMTRIHHTTGNEERKTSTFSGTTRRDASIVNTRIRRMPSAPNNPIRGMIQLGKRG